MSDSTYRLTIGGESVEGAAGTYDIVNPATEELVGRAPEASVEQANAAVEAAAGRVRRSGRAPRPRSARRCMERAADLIDAHADEIVPVLQAETGATMRVAKTMQFPQASARLRRYAKGALQSNIIPLPPAVMPTTALAPGGLISAAVHRAPVGVVTCITSYNFPMTNMAGKIGPALAMGNTVVVKPAPQDPLGVVRMVELMNEAGFPPGVVNVVTGQDIAPSEAVVVAPPAPTWSPSPARPASASASARCAARQMKRQLMELGGKGACIVFDDADLKAAIGGISSVFGFHSGQICTSPTRVIVHRSIHDHLVGGLQQAIGHMKVGDPLERDTVVGPVISAAHRERIEGFIARRCRRGCDHRRGG